MSEEDNLPATHSGNFQLVTPLKHNATESEAIHADLEMSNFMLDALATCWESVRTIKGVTTLVGATIKATKHRRDILKLPYGAPTQNTSNRAVTFLD